MKLSEILNKGEALEGFIEDIEITRPVTDPKRVVSGAAYIIMKNQESAYKEPAASPAVILCGDSVRIPDASVKVIRIKEPRKTAAMIFSRYHGYPSQGMRIIGVTGTAGKTTTATMIEGILRADGHRVGFIGTGRISINGAEVSSTNYSMTTPDPDLLYLSLSKMKKDGCDTVVMEVSSHSLALDKVAAIKFDLGIFTNLSPEHLDFHIDMESYFNSKLKLCSLSKEMLWSIDDEYARAGARIYGGKTAGAIWRGDAWVSDIVDHGSEGIDYIYHGDGFSFIMRLKTAGIYNVYNSMLAIAAATHLGVRPCIAREYLEGFPGVAGRYEIIKDEIVTVIDYAHTVSAFEITLKCLKSSIKPGQNLSVVFGCGGERDRSKRPEMARISEKYADRITVTDDNPRGEDPVRITDDIVAGFCEGRYTVVHDRCEAIRSAILTANTGDTVAIIGKGNERYLIDRDGYHDFDEREIIRDALSERRLYREKDASDT